LAGVNVRTDKKLPALAGWFHERGVERLFITLGARGVFYSTNDAHGIEKLRGNLNDMRNTGGAGDAFLAGLAYAWLNEWPLRKSLGFSLAAATVTLSHEQTSSPAMSLTAVNRLYKGNHAG
jgi:pseudouridine kinase